MSNAPVKRFRLGFVEAAIWANDGSNGNTFHSVKLSRTYKDDDQYKSTDSLSAGDLANARVVLGKALEWIMERG